jgi:hypothetical protein
MIAPRYVQVAADEKERKFTRNPQGPIALFSNGGILYNDHSNHGDCDIPSHLTPQHPVDACGGHGDKNNCMYHYHNLPKCWAEARDENRCHLIGFMHDGLPMFGKCKLRFAESGRVRRMKSCYRMRSGKRGCKGSDYKHVARRGGCNLDKANGYYFREKAVSLVGNMTFLPGEYGYFFSNEYDGPPYYYAGETRTYGGDIGDFCGINPKGRFLYTTSPYLYRDICKQGSFSNNLYQRPSFTNISPFQPQARLAGG